MKSRSLLTVLFPFALSAGCGGSGPSVDHRGGDGGGIGSAGGSSSQLPTIPNINAGVSCTEQAGACHCSVMTPGSAAPYFIGGIPSSCTGAANNSSVDFCCATPDYPKTGTCQCYPPSGWVCTSPMAAYPNQCVCRFSDQANPASLTKCDTSGGKACCGNAKYGSCNCALDNGCVPSAGESRVVDCSSPATAGVRQPPSSCPAGLIKVDLCADPNAKVGGCSLDTCQGCNGTDTVCCHVCQGTGISAFCGTMCCNSFGCF